MRFWRTAFAAFACLVLASCAEANRQLGVSGALQDQVFPAASKKMALLRAEIAMMFLSFVALDSGGRSTAENIAVVAALNRTALDIDCIRSSATGGPNEPSLRAQLAGQARVSLCPSLGGLYFFDTRMVSVERDLLALAKVSLPNASLAKLLDAIPSAGNQPLALIGPVLAVARDAVLIAQRGGAGYRDGIEIEVQVYCANTSDPRCTGVRNNIDQGRHVEKQRLFVTDVITTADSRFEADPDGIYFKAARKLTEINCARLKAQIDATAETINCNLYADGWPALR